MLCLSFSLQGCVGCKSPPFVPPAAPFDVEIHEMELCSVLDVTEDGATGEKRMQPDTAMDDREAEGEAQHQIDEEENDDGRARMMSQVGDQEMAAEEQEVTSQMEDEEEKGSRSADMTLI